MSDIIIKPKLPVTLPGQSIVILEPAHAIENAEVIGADWAGQKSTRVTFDTVRLTDSLLTGASLRESGWSDVEMNGGELGGLDLTATAWRRVAVTKARLSGLIMIESEVRDTSFKNAKLNLANFRFAKLTRLIFNGCDLAEADFAGATLTDVSFEKCDLTGANFDNATLKNVDLRSSQVQDIGGVAGLGGATITTAQLINLAPELALAIGLKIADQ